MGIFHLVIQKIVLQSLLGVEHQKECTVSDLIIRFSAYLNLELKHLNHNLIEISLIETSPHLRGSKTLVAVQHVSKTELEAFLQHRELVV